MADADRQIIAGLNRQFPSPFAFIRVIRGFPSSLFSPSVKSADKLRPPFAVVAANPSSPTGRACTDRGEPLGCGRDCFA